MPVRSHGASGTNLYAVWKMMRQRCLNPRNKDYQWYGGSGISICKRWEKFENFVTDMGLRPEGGTLERINGNKNYTPSNCRWASIQEQQRNRRDMRPLTLSGRTQLSTDWAVELGIPKSTICNRLKNGWSVERTLSTPRRS